MKREKEKRCRNVFHTRGERRKLFRNGEGKKEGREGKKSGEKNIRLTRSCEEWNGKEKV